MPRPKVPSRPRAWPRVAVLALVGVAVAGCENSARFDSSPFASNRDARPEYTGSIAPRPASARSVVAQPLPAPSRPATVAANPGVAYGDARLWRLPAGRACRCDRLGAGAARGAGAGAGADTGPGTAAGR